MDRMPSDIGERALGQSCLTLCDIMDCSPSGSIVHGIFQARIPELVANSCSRKESENVSHSVVSDSVRPHGL